MSKRWTLRPGARASWLATVSVVTLLATLAIKTGTKLEQNHAAKELHQTATSVLAPLGAPANRPALAVNYGKLPLSFEANLGQSRQSADFISRGRGYTMFLSGGEAVLSLRQPAPKRNSKLEARNSKQSFQTPDVLRMKLVGANAQAAVKGMEKLPRFSNYYIGNDPKKWRTGEWDHQNPKPDSNC